MCAKEKGKIDSEVGTTNNDNDFVKFKVHEYNQIHHEKVSYVDITSWQVIHYHFFTLQDDYLQYVRDFIIREAKRPLFEGEKECMNFSDVSIIVNYPINWLLIS